MINRSVNQEDIKMLNVYVFINRASKYMKQKTDKIVEEK